MVLLFSVLDLASPVVVRRIPWKTSETSRDKSNAVNSNSVGFVACASITSLFLLARDDEEADGFGMLVNAGVWRCLRGDFDLAPLTSTS